MTFIRIAKTASPAVSELTGDVIERTRAALGAAEFARLSAVGAGAKLPELVVLARSVQSDLVPSAEQDTVLA